MQTDKVYDIIIVGGGLGGLCLSIQLAKKGISVWLAEKEIYPFHKVCGEYISNESRAFLQKLGVDLSTAANIDHLMVTNTTKSCFKATLPLGGFGISRYLLDEQLKNIAIRSGVHISEQTKVTDISMQQEVFNVKANGQWIRGKICCMASGKKSNLDVQLKRNHLSRHDKNLDNYIGVKYHVKYPIPAGQIQLHNFKNGYCGISAIEDGKHCICYLTTAANLKKANGDIKLMEQKLLSENRYLKAIFEQGTFLYEKPLTISQVSFKNKNIIENNIIMLGDAAGMITPLCGNGMSMAMHASKFAAEEMMNFLSGNISRLEMEQNYMRRWKNQFNGRLKTGRLVQRFFGRERTTGIFIFLMNTISPLAKFIISKTHGKPF